MFVANMLFGERKGFLSTAPVIDQLFGAQREFLPAPAGSWQVGYVDVMTEGDPKLSSFTRYLKRGVDRHYIQYSIPQLRPFLL
jgi:hypothetical protein